MRPDHRLPAIAGLFTALALTGCATTQPEEGSSRVPQHPALQELAAALPGQYATPARAGSSRRLQIEVIADPSAPPGTIRLVMIQTRSDRPDESARQFQWQLQAADGDDNGLQGLFAPMTAAGQTQRHCEMRVNLRREGLTAQTDPADCRFGEGEQVTGLLKEIAFDGSQLVIGDRLIRIPSGESAGEDQITRFVRDRAFTGWAGVRDGSDWRMAVDVEAVTGSSPIEPRDASGMGLGLEIGIDHYEMSRSDQVKLRLSVTDTESGELLGEAWADADARSIGIALPAFQIGLETP